MMLELLLPKPVNRTTKDVMHIAPAALIVRHHIFGEAKSFNGFPERWQEDSVPQLSLTLVHMLLEQWSPTLFRPKITDLCLGDRQDLPIEALREKKTPDCTY